MTTSYPIAEIFHSVQGEGYWVGTPMMFVRLAGCCVGEYDDWPVDKNDKPTIRFTGAELPLIREKRHSICTTFDGQRFLCDTDYHRKETMTPAAIAEHLAGEYHVCITGGEPLMHELEPLARVFNYGAKLHVETSGVRPCPAYAPNFWFTVSPKKGCLNEWLEDADEWKLLVGPEFDESRMGDIEHAVQHRNLFIQPINGVAETNKDNEARCMEILKRHPNWRLSAQLHKYLEVR